VKLRRFRRNIEALRANQPIEIGLFDDVTVKKYVALDTDMRELLDDVRTAAPKSRDAYRALPNTTPPWRI
jgi:hypothetical protein